MWDVLDYMCWYILLMRDIRVEMYHWVLCWKVCISWMRPGCHLDGIVDWKVNELDTLKGVVLISYVVGGAKMTLSKFPGSLGVAPYFNIQAVVRA